MKQKKLNKEIKNNNERVQSFFEIKKVCDDHILKTTGEELYFMAVEPTNITVLSTTQIESLINSLSSVLSQIPMLEILCMDSSQSYEDNLKHLKHLSEIETIDAIREIDKKDIKYLDNIRACTATSRAFYLLLRLKESDSDFEKDRTLTTVMQIFREHKLTVKLEHKEELKKLISIYLEQNVYNERVPDFDGDEYSEALHEYESIKGFVDLVCPSVLDFKHTSYSIIGNTYRSVQAIRSYQTTTTTHALLKSLGEKEGVTLHIYSRVVTPEEKKKIVDIAERRNQSKLRKATKLREKSEGADNLSDLQKLLTQSHKNNELLLHCAVFIETMAETLEDLKTLNASVSQVLIDNRMSTDKLMLQQKDGFIASCPFGFNTFKTEFERVLPSSSVANLYPFSYSGKTDPFGNMIGKDVNGSNILTDFDKRAADKTNGHISIFGNSGEGKSWLTKLLICLFRQQRKALYSIDVENEFYDITKNLGGTNVNMLEGKYFINILEPKLLKSNEDSILDDELVSVNKSAAFNGHIAFLRDFFKVYKPEIPSRQIDILEIMLIKTYKKFNINEETDLTMLSSQDYPTLKDLYKTVRYYFSKYDSMIKEGRNLNYSREDIQQLDLAIKSICVGNESTYFSHHTNLPNADHINFMIHEMLGTNENLKNAMYLNIFSYMQHKYFYCGNTVVVCDEIHEIIKSSIVVSYIRSFVKRGRKRDSNIITCSQNIEDLMLEGISEYTTPLFSIPTHRFLFFPGNVDKEGYKSKTNITENEFDIISTPNQGFCLYCCGDERYHMHVVAPPHKEKLFGTAGGR